MLHRLGQIIFWISTALAVFFCGFAGIALFTQRPVSYEFFLFLVFLAVMLYGFGRVVRYFLSGY